MSVNSADTSALSDKGLDRAIREADPRLIRSVIDAFRAAKAEIKDLHEALRYLRAFPGALQAQARADTILAAQQDRQTEG